VNLNPKAGTREWVRNYVESYKVGEVRKITAAYAWECVKLSAEGAARFSVEMGFPQPRSALLHLLELRRALDGDDAVPQMLREILDLFDCGQKEYAHDEKDAFANFKRIGKEIGIAARQVLWVYALKHRDGIQAHMDGHKSQREDVRGRINDLYVYCILDIAMNAAQGIE
jgi:hypothetical protein